MSLRCLTISSQVSLALLLGGCFSSGPAGTDPDDPYYHIMHGTIMNPFFKQTEPLGRAALNDKFVIRTVSGGTEYIVEIPHAAVDYNVEVPLAQFDSDLSKSANRNPSLTDRELVGAMPVASTDAQDEKALVDKAMGVGEAGGPSQAPSYALGLAKINEFYRSQKFEFALIEINNLLSFYPTSVKLLKMKGTILVKMGNLALAERAWAKGAQLDPNDAILTKGLATIREKLALNQGTMSIE